jgi:hypothetical protein
MPQIAEAEQVGLIDVDWSVSGVWQLLAGNELNKLMMSAKPPSANLQSRRSLKSDHSLQKNECCRQDVL